MTIPYYIAVGLTFGFLVVFLTSFYIFFLRASYLEKSSLIAVAPICLLLGSVISNGPVSLQVPDEIMTIYKTIKISRLLNRENLSVRDVHDLGNAESEKYLMMHWLENHPEASSKQLTVIYEAKKDDLAIVRDILEHPNLPIGVQNEVVKNISETDVSDHIVWGWLANHKTKSVRLALTTYPNVPDFVLKQLIEDTDSEVGEAALQALKRKSLIRTDKDAVQLLH
jgi:hypothetical protein